MRSFTATIALLALPFSLAQPGEHSPKRGLAHVGEDIDESDNRIFDSDDAGLSWYYNWSPTPSTDLNDNLQFVPMLWGADGSQNFYSTVKNQIDSGANITWVLGFNEPDGCEDVYGASCIDAQTAASIWIEQVEPLREDGVSLGAPGVTGSQRGVGWLQEFFTACAGQCTPDFLPIHFYGPMESMAAFIGQVNASYSNMTFWVTEFANSYAETLDEAQSDFNRSIGFLDQHEYVDKYSYFGAFRSDVSNVGANAAMLTQDGELTDIGAWYLGQEATGNIPEGGSSAARSARFVGSSFLVAAVVFWSLG